MIEARVSKRWIASFLAILFIIGLHTAVFFSHKAARQSTKTVLGVSPVRKVRYYDIVGLTAGLTGRGSISNLQIYVFSMIVLFLLVYLLLRLGSLSGLSENVLWLLGIVGAGSVSARLVARARDKLTPLNLRWLLKRGWLQHSSNQIGLINRDREFAVTRFQSIAFSGVVAIALLVNGFTGLETFTIPASLLALLTASQAIYVVGKGAQPAKGDDTAFQELNNLIDETRGLEDKILKHAPGKTNEKDIQKALSTAGQPDLLDDYKKKAQEAANRFSEMLEVDMPTTGIHDLSIA